MKKSGTRRNDGSLFPHAAAAVAAASSTPLRQHMGKTISRRTGVSGMRIRHAMTTLTVLTIAMATFMIIMAATKGTDHTTTSNHRHAPDDHLSPLAHALSSSRRRNLSQLLPEEENGMKRVEETSSGKSSAAAAGGKDDDEVQIRKLVQQQKAAGKAAGKDDDEAQIRTLLRQQKEQQKKNNQVPVTSDAKEEAKVVNEQGITTTSDGSTNLSPKGTNAALVGAASPGVDVRSDANESAAIGQVQPLPVIGLQEEHVLDENATTTTVTTNDTDALDQGFGNMLHHLPEVELGTSTIATDAILSAVTHIQRKIPANPRKQSIYVSDANNEMMERIQEVESRNDPEDPAFVPDGDPVDPLWANVSDLNLTVLEITPQVPHLGVLLDAGRHYFPIAWLKNMMRYLHAMNFNFVHFRLTDDQTFNINLTSYPQLASPVTYNNPNHLVYSKEELRDLVQFAERLNITIMPEINIPGHAGSWAGVPGLIVNCPEFICQKGYGVPINVTHPELPKILKSIIKEVREVFYTSPYLHLGGDEVHMARPCFDELNEVLFDYGPFENMLKGVLKELNISNDVVLRWEMTGQQIEGRAGNMIHFWESDPGQRLNATGPYFISNGLYFDTNGRDRAYDVYEKSSRHLRSSWTPDLKAIVVGTFELDPDFWFQRNVIGRLIGVAMGASGRTYDDLTNFTADYSRYCSQLQMDPKLCALQGLPVVEQHVYYGNWQGAWSVWKNGICDRLTYPLPSRAMMPVYNWRQQMLEQVNREFWTYFARELRYDGNGTVLRGRIRPPKYDFVKIKIPDEVVPIRQHAIAHTGVILDLVNSHPTVRQLEEIIDQLSFLGFNLIQLRLADDFGYAMAIPISQGNRLEFRAGRYGTPISYDHMSLARVVDYAERQGNIKTMPEISVSTNAGGWYKVGFGLSCPNVICAKGRGIANDITEPELLPVVGSIIRDLRKIFSSDFVHLGADERELNVACFNESHKRTNFNTFERKLAALLELEGVDIHNVLRWENEEHKRYRGRAGKITHFRELQNSTSLQQLHRRPDKGEAFFANSDIFEGSAWDIYQRTRDLVRLKPNGIMAEIRTVLAWSDRQTFGRLLAFALGVSTLPPWTKKTYFRGNFTDYCQAMVGKVDTIDKDDCKWFEFDPQNWEVEVETDAFRDQSCNAQTYMVTKRLVRTNITAY